MLLKASRIKELDRDVKKWLDEEDRKLAEDFYVSARIRERAFKIYLKTMLIRGKSI